VAPCSNFTPWWRVSYAVSYALWVTSFSKSKSKSSSVIPSSRAFGMIWGSLLQLLTRLRRKTFSAPPNTISAESADHEYIYSHVAVAPHTETRRDIITERGACHARAPSGCKSGEIKIIRLLKKAASEILLWAARLGERVGDGWAARWAGQPWRPVRRPGLRPS
jgi:hypothetical protein